MRTLLTSILMLIISANFSLAQNTPAALRGDEVSVEENISPDRGEIKTESFKEDKEEELKDIKIRKPKKWKKLKRHDLAAGMIWFFILLTLSALVWFLVFVLPWWVVLIISLSLLIAAFIVLMSSEPKKPNRPGGGRWMSRASTTIAWGVVAVITVGLVLSGLIIWGLVALILAIIN